MFVFTFGQNLWDLSVAGAESAVDLEAICIIQEWTTQGEQHFLWKEKKNVFFLRNLNIFAFNQGYTKVKGNYFSVQQSGIKANDPTVFDSIGIKERTKKYG